MKKPLLTLILLSYVTVFAQKKDSIPTPQILVNESSQIFGAARNLSKLVGPNPAAFEKKSSIPINYNTGQINFSVPLFNLAIDDYLNIPIELSNSGSGLKPDEVPSYVGNGWDVSVGGTIVQYHKGIDDFQANGLQNSFYRDKLASYNNNTLTGATKHDYFWQIANQTIDSQFDAFSINLFNKKSNRFFFDRDTVKFFKKDQLKVELLSGVFTVTDDHGYKYIFDHKITSSGTYQNDAFDGTVTFQEGTSTWFLSQIITPNNLQVNFSYLGDIVYEIREQGKSYSSGYGFQGEDCVLSSGYAPYNSLEGRTVSQNLLKSIDFPQGKVEFVLKDRNDLISPSGQKSKALEAIRMRNINNEVMGKVVFETGYMDNTTQDRLVLNGIALAGKDTSITQTYGFEYYPASGAVPIPGLVKPDNTQNAPNHAVDYQGYYNGNTSNTDKVPQFNYSSVNPYNTAGTVVGGANRRPNPSYSKWGMLQKVTSPDKGFEEFEYEANTYKISTSNASLYEVDDLEPFYTEVFRSEVANCDTLIKTFNISSAISNAKVFLSIESHSHSVSIKIKRLSDMVYVVNTTQNPTQEWEQTLTINLSAGDYQYEIFAPCSMDNFTSAKFDIEAPVSGFSWVKTGGNRISKTRRFPKVGQADIRRIKYLDGLATTSIDFSFHKYSALQVELSNACDVCGTAFVVGDNNTRSYDGFHVEYSQVKESSHLQGKAYFQYKPWADIGLFPFFSNSASRPALPWRSGLLTKNELKNDNSTVQIQETNYTELDITPFTLKSLIVKFNYHCPTEETYDPNNILLFSEGIVPVYTDKFGKISEINNRFSDNNTLLQTDTSIISYNNRWQPYRVQKSRSVGGRSSQTTYFAEDFNNISGTQIATLKSKHILGKPLKIINDIDGNTTDGTAALPDANGNFTEIQSFESGTNHMHNPAVFPGSDFSFTESRTYNSKGKMSGFTTRNGVSYVYLWSYNFTHPVAIVANATSTEVSAIIGNIETFGALTNESTIAASLTSLRTGLSTAQVTSALYNVGIGIKQLTQPSGISYYYEYDGMNRLKKVLDNEGKEVDLYVYQNALTLITN